MTDYTDNRGYPYPSSEREAGNGGLHSELLARAVAADLDVLDAGWAAQAQRPSKILGMTVDSAALNSVAFNTGVEASGLMGNFNTVTAVRQAQYFTSSVTEVQVLADGWYWANLNLKATPTGALAAGSRLQTWLQHMTTNTAGFLVVDSQRHGDVYWATSTLDTFTMASGMFRMKAGDRFQVRWSHSNASSTVAVKANNTFLEVNRVRGLS